MPTRENPLSGIDPGAVTEAYASRGLAQLSDVELFHAAAAIIAQPKHEVKTSFELHAPLELLARCSLLPLVVPDDRARVRMQIVASTALYQSSGSVIPDVHLEKSETRSPAQLIRDLRQAIQNGEVQQSDDLFTALAVQGSPRQVLGSVADFSLRTLTAAAHVHVGLMLLARGWSDATVNVFGLARAGIRALAETPELNLKPTIGPGKLSNLEQALASVPQVPADELSIVSMVRAAENAGVIEEVLGSGWLDGSGYPFWEDAVRTACRVGAISMLNDSSQGAKYIWSHCLTLPQAAWALTRFLEDSALQWQAARSTVSWVAMLRATQGNGRLDLEPNLYSTKMAMTEALLYSPETAAAVAWYTKPEDRGKLARILATEAAIRTDAHLSKYVRACFDVALMDPQAAPLYYAAAAYLCSLWCKEEPREVISERLGAVRD